MDTKNDNMERDDNYKYSAHFRSHWEGRCSDGRHHEKRLWMGIAIILFGVVLLSHNLNFLSYELKRYVFTWESILIALGLLFIFFRGKRSGGLILLMIGGIFYMKNVLNIIDFNFWEVFFPAMLIFVGIMIIFRHQLDRNPEKKKLTEEENKIDEIAVFGGGDRIVTSQQFQGGKVTAIFGGLNFNMLKAKLAPGENVIDVFCVLGGMKLIVPEGWTVKIQVMSLFGGFSDKHRYRYTEIDGDQNSQLIIKGTCIFGGGEIKSSLE